MFHGTRREKKQRCGDGRGRGGRCHSATGQSRARHRRTEGASLRCVLLHYQAAVSVCVTLGRSCSYGAIKGELGEPLHKPSAYEPQTKSWSNVNCFGEN
ncbi:hypothetical protein AAFF_G00104720 [Aldrovandia affinis]|uniref:Uncharacterized protein n=1 Tax=Aldrovandia affinis TaxID=143900 RepID=A0AAD7WXR2_9TELE|nr:hypothetical protein AAFF_G00104720 [Aldrovandia affinis]